MDIFREKNENIMDYSKQYERAKFLLGEMYSDEIMDSVSALRTKEEVDKSLNTLEAVLKDAEDDERKNELQEIRKKAWIDANLIENNLTRKD